MKHAYISKLIFLALLLLPGFAQPAWSDGWSVKDKDGKQYQLSMLKGKWVLVNFWATWCPPCLNEIPELVKLHQKYPVSLEIIGIAVMFHDRQEVLDVARNQGISYPVVLGNEDIASEFGEIEGLPTSYLYAPSGALVGKHEGPLTGSEVEAAMQQKAGSNRSFAP